jgi:hypothetical protein
MAAACGDGSGDETSEVIELARGCRAFIHRFAKACERIRCIQSGRYAPG